MRSLAQPCSVSNTFFSLWEGQKWGLFPKDRTYRAFLHNKRFFSDSPEGFALLSGQCAALRSPAQSTTPFLASGKAKNGVFSLRIAHIALFYTINVFSDSPEGFALLLGQCAALRSLAQSTTPFLASGKAKNGFFSLRIAHTALFYTINLFF